MTYVRMKRARCAKAGIESRLVSLPATTTTAELVETLQSLSRNAEVHGILLQHPVGPHIDERAAFEAIAPEKDVDEVTMSSFGAMSFGLPGFASCTPGGIMRLLDEYDVDLAGQHAVVVGPSAVLGNPPECSCSPGTPRSLTATPVRLIWPRPCGERTLLWRPWDGLGLFAAKTSSRGPS
ncbi:hypothetical protein GCM10010344_00720 [Streptomyces bluensis]|nr:hypothetical protein GCM10010344_00720 [Streptomyces bluensis]